MNYLIRTWHIELVHTYIPFLSVSFRSRLGRETVRFDDSPNPCPDAAIITSYANNVSPASPERFISERFPLPLFATWISGFVAVRSDRDRLKAVVHVTITLPRVFRKCIAGVKAV